jgi:LysM repeat protein
MSFWIILKFLLLAAVLSIKIQTNLHSSLKTCRSHTVVEGDTLFKIAKNYNTTVEELVKLNEIKDPDLIYPGQIIKLPPVASS